MGVSWQTAAALFSFGLLGLVSGQDTLGLANGYTTLSTTNFDAKIVKDAQVLASLKPAGGTFDFLPFDYLSKRAANGQYHIGDITFRYRTSGSTAWIDGNSALARKKVTVVSTGALASSLMTPTFANSIPLNITREWVNVSGDLGLNFTLKNTGQQAVEIGSLGFPTEFNSIFTDRTAEQIQQLCSLTDPYIGMHAGYLRVSPVSGTGPALVVTPMGDTPLEAYRNLQEPSLAGTYYGSQTFEGFYEWQVLTRAWAEKEWSGKTPWNPPSYRTIQPGGSLTFGLRFSVAKDGIRGIENAVKQTGTPFAVGIPGHIVPRDLPAQLFLTSASEVSNITTTPANAFTISNPSSGAYVLTPSTSAWGRVRLTIQYNNGKTQTVHYYLVKAATDAIGNLGNFLTTSQWFTNTSDPFGRAPSVMTYDYEAKAIVMQDNRVWVAGLSDEAGAGSFLSAMMKQAAQPNAAEITKLEQFVDKVLRPTIQTTDSAVRKSIFFYEPAAVPGYSYRSDISWTGWESWNKAAAYSTDRAYDYVHVAASYWALYRVARAYPDLVKTHPWGWYLDQAYNTVMRCMQKSSAGYPTVGYSQVGLMGETVFGEILSDLKREGRAANFTALEASMRSRATAWNSEAVPFGSEMAWDSTGQEGVYYWCKYFAYTSSATKALNTVLGFMPTVAHWGWNGNARRYWDNIYGGKLRRIERQIHHYGSGLNSLVLLSGFRSNPSDPYLLRVGYGGMNGPLSNINQDGFAAASFHSWPDTLTWDGYSGDYGPGFVGLVLGSGTYVAQESGVGLVAYGGILTAAGDTVTVQPRDAIRRKVYIGPLGLLISLDAGIIQAFSYNPTSKQISVTISQLDGVPKAPSAVLWIETTAGTQNYTVVTTGLQQARLGWQIPLSNSFTVQIGPA